MQQQEEQTTLGKQEEQELSDQLSLKNEFMNHLNQLMDIENLHLHSETLLNVQLLLWKREIKQVEDSKDLFQVYHPELMMRLGLDNDERMGQLIDQLLSESSSPDQIREQRVGVVLAIVHHHLRRDRLIELIKKKNTPVMILDLIVKNITSVLDVDDFMKLFNDEYDQLSDHVRIRMERCVRKTRPQWIQQMLNILIKHNGPTRECLHMLGHLESGKHNDYIVKVLKDLNMELKDIIYGPLFRKHGNAVGTYLKDRLDELLVKNHERTAQYLTVNKIIEYLLKNFPRMAWNFISNYLIQPFLERQQSPQFLAKYYRHAVFYSDPSFVETALKIIPITQGSFAIPSLMASKLTIKQTAKILHAMIESFGYMQSSRSEDFINGFLIFTKARKFVNRDILFENMYSLGLDKEKFVNWIVNNSNIDKLPNILNTAPHNISSMVAERLYQIRKKKIFKNSSEESKFWKYFFDLDNSEQRNQFKNACSNPAFSVRLEVLQDLLFCSLNSGKQVKETLEFCETRLRNDEEVRQRFLNNHRREESFKALFVTHFKEHQESILLLFERLSLSSSVTNFFYREFLESSSNNVEICKKLLIQIERNGERIDPRSKGSKNFYFSKTVHQELFNHFRPILEEMIRNDSFYLLNFLLQSIQKPHQYDYINDFVTEIMENFKDISVFDTKKVFEIYLKCDPKNIHQRVKTILSKFKMAFQMPCVQRALIDRRNVHNPQLLSQFLPDHVLGYEEIGLKIRNHSPLAWNPEVLSGLRLAEYAPKQLLQSFSTYYKDYLFKVCRTGEIVTFYKSRYSSLSERKQTLKLLPKLLYEKPMLDDLVNFIDEKLLSDIPLDTVMPTRPVGRVRGGFERVSPTILQKPTTIEFNVTNVDVKSLAKLVRTNSQYPLEHLDYILNNINSENVMFFCSALNRLSKFETGFVSKFINILKEKFSSGPNENFTISIQKVFVSFFKQHVDFSGINPLVNEIAEFLVYLWDLKPHKDVQVAIVKAAKKLASKSHQYEVFTKLERLFQDAVSHEYESVVEEFVSYLPSFNLKIGQELFLLSLKALSHKDVTTQSKVWSRISLAVNRFDARAVNDSFDPKSLFNSYLIDALLSFDSPEKDSKVTSVAIENISKGLLENTKEMSVLLLEKILKPLFTKEQFLELNKKFDRPVSERLKLLATRIAMEISTKIQSIQEETLHSLQYQLILPWLEMVTSLDDKLSHTCLVSCMTNWTCKDSIIENNIKRVAQFFSDIPELKQAAVSTLCHNRNLFVLTSEHYGSIIQVASEVLSNHTHFSQEEITLTVTLLKFVDSNQEIENLMTIVSSLISTHPLLAVTYFIRNEIKENPFQRRIGVSRRPIQFE